MNFVNALTFSTKDVRDPEADEFLSETDEYLREAPTFQVKELENSVWAPICF